MPFLMCSTLRQLTKKLLSMPAALNLSIFEICVGILRRLIPLLVRLVNYGFIAP